MKNNVLILLLSCLFIATNANAQSFEWVETYGNIGYDEIREVEIDASGNLYSFGHFQQSIDFDPGSGINSHTALGGNDIFIQKVDRNGNFSWVKSFGGKMDDFAAAMGQDHKGNLYLAGIFHDTLKFNGGTGNSFASKGELDVFILKMDTAGTLLWTKTIGGSLDDQIHALSIDKSGNIVLFGRFKDSVDFDPGAGVQNLTTVGRNDVFILKMDPLGNFLWVKAIEGDWSYPKSVATDNANNVYTTGRFSGTLDFNPGSGIHNISSNSTDAFIQKLDSNGNFVWAKRIGGGSLDDASKIKIDQNNNVITAGVFQDTVDFDPGINTKSIISNGLYDVFLHKMDANGNFIWVKTYGGISNEFPYNFDFDPMGDLYVTGLFFDSVDFDPGIGSKKLYGASGDMYIQKLDSNGDFLWAKNFGGSGFTRPYYINIDQHYNIYSAGSFRDTIDFDPGPGVNTHVSVRGWDCFLHKMSQSSITSIEEFKSDEDLFIYPNPSNGMVQIQLKQTLNNVQLHIRNVLGELLFTKNYTSFSHETIELPENKGIYILTIESDHGQYQRKLIRN